MCGLSVTTWISSWRLERGTKPNVTKPFLQIVIFCCRQVFFVMCFSMQCGFNPLSDILDYVYSFYGVTISEEKCLRHCNDLVI